jgi:Uma2 family endonuclease
MPSTELHQLPSALSSAPAMQKVLDEFPYPPQDLPSEDGVPLETNWHRVQMNLLIELIECHRRGQNDFFAGGNMFVHFSEEEVRNRDFRGPDFFLVNGVSHRQDRPYWAIWKEGGRYPDLIIELMSPTTRDIDLTTKFEVYEKTFATREYVAYDPDTRQIHAWRKSDKGRFRPIVPNNRDHYYLEVAELWLGTWRGKHQDENDATWLRLFDEFGNLVPTKDEISDAEKARADAAVARADSEKARADAADARADSERARADAVSAELARLKAQLANPS